MKIKCSVAQYCKLRDSKEPESYLSRWVSHALRQESCLERRWTVSLEGRWTLSQSRLPSHKRVEKTLNAWKCPLSNAFQVVHNLPHHKWKLCMTISYVGFLLFWIYSVSVSKCLYNAVILEIKRNGEKITENEKQIRALNLQIANCF